jgi:hypothetical protein
MESRMPIHSPSAGQLAGVGRVSGPRTVSLTRPRWRVTTSSQWLAATERKVPARSL